MTDQIERINALTANARSTWFALLSALLFVGVTLMGVKHIDFWGVDRATQLPLVNFSVPTRLFFLAAPILTAAIYSYFHLYLIRLWDAIGAAPSRVNGNRLGDAAKPWLVTDSALCLRRIMRRDNCIAKRQLDFAATFLNLLLNWLFGLIILGFLWYQSLPARDALTAIIAALSFLAAVLAGGSSLLVMIIRMASPLPRIGTIRWAAITLKLAALIAAPLLLVQSNQRTSGTPEQLAPLILTGESIVQRPAGWLPPQIAKARAQAKWCQRVGLDVKTCNDSPKNQQDTFDREWDILRIGEISDLKKPGNNTLRPETTKENIEEFMGVGDLEDVDLHAPDNLTLFIAAVAEQALKAPDFRGADLRDSFLVGANLLAARMQGARAQGINLERADLSFANLTGRAKLSDAILTKTDLRWAQLQNATLFRAQLQNADLTRAQLQNADLSRAQLQNAFLYEAQLQNADLGRAQLQNADLGRAQLQNADLSRALLQNADLVGAKLQNADLGRAQLQNAVLAGAQLQNADLYEAQLQNADLYEAQLQNAVLAGAQLQNADLAGAKLQNATLFRAKLQNATLFRAQLQNADLSRAQLQNADLSLSLLTAPGRDLETLKNTSLRASTNNGGALREVDLTSSFFDIQSDWRNAFLDASVTVPPKFRHRMNDPCQWHWAENYKEGQKPLSDEQFFGLWRGWLERSPVYGAEIWKFVAPEGWQDVPAVTPPANCVWQTGTLRHDHGGGR